MTSRFQAAAAQRQLGYTLVETLVTLVIAAIVTAGLAGVMGQAMNTYDQVSQSNDLTSQGRFALQRMLWAARSSQALYLPLQDDPASNWPENLRQQSVPPSVPTGDSTLASAVLAVALPRQIDLDGDGFADADDDEDGLIDEDPPADLHNDAAAGIFGVDDDGAGDIDEGDADSDDESDTVDDDPLNSVDDDGDNSINEDMGADLNADGCAGFCAIDDDGDGSIDEGNASDDDEDGQEGEDWFNAIVYRLDNGNLIERMPVPWDEDASGTVDGRDVIESVLVENVTLFRVERINAGASTVQLLDIVLEITSPANGEPIQLQTRVRLGAGS